MIDHVPQEYAHDLARDLAQAVQSAPHSQVIRDWEATLEEIALAGDKLPNILQERAEARAGIGMTPNELLAYLESDDEQWQEQPVSPSRQFTPA